MWRKDKYYVLHGMTLNWWFTYLYMVKAVHLAPKDRLSVTQRMLVDSYLIALM